MTVRVTVSATAVRRTRHQGGCSVTRYSWLSVPTIAVIPDDVLQSAASRLEGASAADLVKSVQAMTKA
jgi:hypothetical protein